MDTATLASHRRQPELLGQTVIVIGGSAGIGLETARRARAEGANVILTARNPERLQGAASELAALRTAAFDANDPASLERFFQDLPTPIDHVMVTGPGPRYWPLMEMEFDQAARLAISEHIMAEVRARKRRMVDGLVSMHIDKYKGSGAELVFAEGSFVGPKTIEVRLKDGGVRTLEGERVFLNLGIHAAIP